MQIVFLKFRVFRFFAKFPDKKTQKFFSCITYGRHGIMSTDIIPALICVRPEGGQFLLQIMRIRRRHHVRRTWYNVGRKQKRGW